MATLPLQAVFEGDLAVLLVPVDDGDAMSAVAEKVAHHVADRRVPAQDRPLVVTFKGSQLPDDVTATAAGIGPMDVIRVGYR